MQVVDNVPSLRALLASRPGIALVPTMGNLHDGHIALVQMARREGKVVVVSIFVNRLQFGPREDFDRYPRTMAADCGLLAREGVDYVFAPEEKTLYPEPQGYLVAPSAALADVLEGEFRPGFFRGVATVVLKLFNIIQPELAVFGKKDYQQLRVIEAMVRQLNLPVRVVAGETVRADDGLALSSRNAYLSSFDRDEAARLHRVLAQVRDAIATGNRDYGALEEHALATLSAHRWTPDYVAVRRQTDLAPAAAADRELVVLAAARLGNTRLIDNLEITG
jgi:pantoate--beta-alanine ligase